MSEITADNIFSQIVQLPSSELTRLRHLLDQMDQAEQKPSEPMLTHQQKVEKKRPKPPLDKRVPPIPVPDSAREMRWIANHRREYAGQWVALDGDRLIAHSPNHDEVWVAAQADGASLPMVTFIEDPDKLYAGF
ncbi:MAG: DUF5678 domain-containing protein [Blastocatellia bacterium]